jgi:hypothetical protein
MPMPIPIPTLAARGCWAGGSYAVGVSGRDVVEGLVAMEEGRTKEVVLEV